MRELNVTSHKQKHIINDYVSLCYKSNALKGYFPHLLVISEINDDFRTSLRNLSNIGGLRHV
jgi:hypothetical protein